MPDTQGHSRTKFAQLDLGPDLNDLGPHALVPFVARRLKRARVVWINERFWLGHGVDILDPVERGALETWLLDTYACCVPADVAPEEMEGPDRIFYADRYGASGGATHGGSGRCGINGRLNVKGIGRTPLVAAADVVNTQHSHGCVWLDEAIREALAGEICAAEYPHGAVPVVAVIDCGIRHKIAEWSFTGHRALIIRPNFVRLAHLQRSTFFGSAGTPQSDQHLDAQRTRDAVLNVWGPSHRRDTLGIQTKTLAQSMERFADQVAFSYVHRFYFGGISSSNLAIDGQVVDFGAFTFVPSWAKTIYNDELPRYGDEAASIRVLLQSLTFFQDKYLPEKEDVATIADAVLVQIYHSFGRYIAEACAPEQGAGAVADLVKLFRYYFSQQQKRTDYLDGRLRKSWIYRALKGGRSANPTSLNGEVVLAIKRILSSEGPLGHLSKKEIQGIMAGLRRWARPRPLLLHKGLVYHTRKLADQAGDAKNLAVRVHELIDQYLSISRRVWRDLPAGYIVVAQVCRGAGSAVLCRVPRSGKYIVILYGMITGGQYILFDQKWRQNSRLTPVALPGEGFTLNVPVKGRLSAAQDVKAQTGIDLPAMFVLEA